MITKEGKLEIFENFKKDDRLPKFQTKKMEAYRVRDPDQLQKMESTGQTTASVIVTNSTATTAWGGGSMFVMSNPVTGGINVGEDNESSENWSPKIPPSAKKSFWSKLFPKKVRAPIPTVSIQDFFKSVKNTAEELAIVEERATGYEEAIQGAMKNGQTALVERLTAGLHAARLEALLEGMGIVKYIEGRKGLALTWMKNFARIIPDDVVHLKVLADEREIFDNYVVLHYDPKGTNVADTKEEIERKKDPILFGVFEGRRRLYFVGDWEDEFCNLTLDKIADTIGGRAVRDLSREVVK
jgi:hypothetical protein